MNTKELYSDMAIERDELKKTTVEQKEVIENLRQIIEKLKQEKETLIEENILYKEREEIIIKTLRPSGI